MKKRIIRVLLALLTANIALVLLTQALSLQATAAHPMQGELVHSGEHQLHIIDSGLSPGDDDVTIVLIHGASTSALDFSTNLHPRLAEHRRVLSVDRPGHGYSERGPRNTATDPAQQAKMILDALHTMSIDNPVLIGHSWAGSIVMAALMATHDNVTVKAGVLIAGAIHPWEGGSAWHIELSARPVIGDIFTWQYISPLGRLSIEGAVAGAFTPEDVPADYVDNTGLTLSLRPETYKNNSLDRTQLSDHLAKQAPKYPTITQPLLSIASTTDPVVPAWNHHDRLVEQLDHLQALKLSDAGHAPHHTRTEVVANAIESFIRKLP